MTEGSDLTHPTMVEHNGILYVSGYRAGGQYLKRSANGGKSWLRFADGNTERLIARPASPQRAGLVKMQSGGRRLVAAVGYGTTITLYASPDEGETWQRAGTV